MRSVLNACRGVTASGRVLLEEVSRWLGGATPTPVAPSVVYVYADRRAERITTR